MAGQDPQAAPGSRRRGARAPVRDSLAAWAAHGRSEAALVTGCREGRPEPLTALAYALADDIWGAVQARADRRVRAKRPAPTPEEALAWAERGMDAGLARLGGWTAPSLADVRGACLGALGARLRALDGSATAPPEVVEALARRAVEAGPRFHEKARRRAFWRLQGYAVVAALALGIVILLVGYQTIGRVERVPRVVFETVQFRVRHTGMGTLVRDLAWDLPDPKGADRTVAGAMEEAAVMLDEIAALSPSDAATSLPYMALRLHRTGTVQALEAAAGRGLGPPAALLDVSLTLEEVEHCYGAGG